jgi:hypothetical protein
LELVLLTLCRIIVLTSKVMKGSDIPPAKTQKRQVRKKK